MNRFLFFRGQQIGIIVLLVLIVAVVALDVLLPRVVSSSSHESESDSAFVAQVKRLRAVVARQAETHLAVAIRGAAQRAETDRFRHAHTPRAVRFRPEYARFDRICAHGFQTVRCAAHHVV